MRDNFSERGDVVPMPLIAADYGVVNSTRKFRDLSKKDASYVGNRYAEGRCWSSSRAPIGYRIGQSLIFDRSAACSNSTVPYIVRLFVHRSHPRIVKAFALRRHALPKRPGTSCSRNVSGKIVAAIAFPLPPLAEQHRIVAKVDELMGLCDRLEAARASREAARDRLAAASLARLNAPDPETFQADARFALDALPALTTRPDQIKALRQTILNLAVRGKLVPQDCEGRTGVGAAEADREGKGAAAEGRRTQRRSNQFRELDHD